MSGLESNIPQRGTSAGNNGDGREIYEIIGLQAQTDKTVIASSDIQSFQILDMTTGEDQTSLGRVDVGNRTTLIVNSDIDLNHTFKILIHV